MEKKKYACNTRAKNKWNAENYDPVSYTHLTLPTNREV